MFDSVLIANRGEIAVRIIRTLRRLSIRSVAVFSDADRDARHVREADLALRIGPASPLESYLNVERILDAAALAGAQAIHPGYGFLSENVNFVRACEDASVVFIGPGADAVDLMGDKIRAKLAVMAAGVPIVPGRTAPSMSDDDLEEAALEIGFPIIVKPSAGGGGKGMRLVEEAELLRDALRSARREAVASFGDDTLFIERYVKRPRHIEVQILADSYRSTVHLGERECSLQRRHQKVVEEAPSTLLDESTRARICQSAITTAQSVGYRGVGTVEFIVSSESPDEFFFMEMNTRLQVEHPVTEMITGLDLVEQQLRVAAGEHLSFAQGDLSFRGHSIEARIYAEDPARDFLPTGGKVLLVREPTGEGVRVDSSLSHDMVVGTNYDPMLAKVIVWGPDRTTALTRLDRALGETVVLGVTTNVAFLRALLGLSAVKKGDLDTGLIERELDVLVRTEPHVALDPEVCGVFALSRLSELQPRGPVLDRWEVPDAWRVGGAGSLRWIVAGPEGTHREIALTGTADEASITVRGLGSADDDDTVSMSGSVSDEEDLGEGVLRVTIDGHQFQVLVARVADSTWLWMKGRSYVVRDQSGLRVGADALSANGEVRSPMPGAVVELRIVQGTPVEVGDRLVVIEAMKMEHALVAPLAGVATEVLVSVGDQVTVDQLLIRIETDVDPTGDVTGERMAE